MRTADLLRFRSLVYAMEAAPTHGKLAPKATKAAYLHPSTEIANGSVVGIIADDTAPSRERPQLPL